MNTSVIEAIERQKTTTPLRCVEKHSRREIVSWCAWRHFPTRSTCRIGVYSGAVAEAKARLRAVAG